MSFRDFDEEGPGTFSWDYVLGQNTIGLFPDETHYIIEGDVLKYQNSGIIRWRLRYTDMYSRIDCRGLLWSI